MIRISARLLLAVCLLVGALPPGSFARAEERLVWTEKASPGFVSLAYGALDPEKPPLFLLSCFNAMSITVLDVRRDGVRVGIEAPGGIKIQRDEVVRAVTEAKGLGGVPAVSEL